MKQQDQTTIQKQERENRPTRFEPRNFQNVENPEQERIDYKNKRMEEALGIDFINSRRTETDEENVMDELGIDQVNN